MKILIVSLLKRKITPKITAARPRVIFDLVSGLLKRRHKITILGTGDSSVPGAKIIPVIPKSFVNMPAFENPFYAETGYLVKLAKALEKIGNKFDVVHNHTYPEFINLLVADKLKVPILTTIHAQMTPQLDEVFSQFNDLKNCYYVSISQAHRKLAKRTKVWKVIHNGVDTNLYRFHSKKEDYLLWLGRLSKAKDKKGNFIDPKGVKWAIKLAKATNSKLLLSGNVEDPEFFNKDVKPYLSKKIRWIGPVSPEQPLTKKQVAKLMQKAKVFLMTVNWYEPFGLVMAESMSCGTPVIGFDRGSVSELLVNGKTGFVVKPGEGIKGLKKALRKIDQIKPEDCRRHVEKNFSLERMVENYEKAYRDLIIRKK